MSEQLENTNDVMAPVIDDPFVRKNGRPKGRKTDEVLLKDAVVDETRMALTKAERLRYIRMKEQNQKVLLYKEQLEIRESELKRREKELKEKPAVIVQSPMPVVQEIKPTTTVSVELSRDEMKLDTMRTLYDIVRNADSQTTKEKACNDLLNFINKEREIDSQEDLATMLKKVNRIGELSERIRLLKRTGSIDEPVSRVGKTPQVADGGSDPDAGNLH